MEEITVLNRQSLLDIGIIISGSPEAAFQLALENDLSITDELKAGSKLTYSRAIIDQRIYDYYRNENLRPATNLVKEEFPVLERFFDMFFDEYFG